MKQSFKQNIAQQEQNINRNSVNNIQNGLYITSSKELRQSQQKQYPVTIQTSTQATTTKSSRGASPPNSRKNIEDSFYKSKCVTGEECMRQKRVQIQNQQQLDQQKNILDEFLKYNQMIQKTSDEYINTRKQWNKSYELAKNKKIINIKGEEEQNTITIAKYMLSNNDKSFEEQLNDSLLPSLRQSPKNQESQQKENVNPTVSQLSAIQLEGNTKSENTQSNVPSTPLKIYQNNKVYKNQYAQKISTKIFSQSKKEKQSNCTDNIKIKYIDTDLNTFYQSPFAGASSRTPNKDINFSQDRKQRASSVVTKRPNSSQGNGNEFKKKFIKAKLNTEIPLDLQPQNNRKKLDKFQLDDFQAATMNQIIPLSTQNNIKQLDSFTEAGAKLSQNNYSTKSSFRQKDSSDNTCQTEPNNSIRINQKLTNRISFTNQTISQNTSTEPDSFLITDYKLYNSKVQYKNNGRRFRSQMRASSQQAEILPYQMIPISGNSLNQEQIEPLIKTEDILIGQKSTFDSDRVQKQNPLNQTQILSNNKNQEKEGENKKVLIGSILRRDYENRIQLISQQNGEQDFNSNEISPNNQIHFSNISQIDSQISQNETDLAAYQYIEKLKREKRKRQEEEHIRFITEKQKMNEQFNDFCIKRQLANSMVNKSIQINEGEEIKNPRDFYQAKNNQKMQEISQKCQKIYQECISQLQFPSQVFPNQANQESQMIQKNQQQQQQLQQENQIIQKSIQFEPAPLTLPRLSPLNSTNNASTKLPSEQSDKRHHSVQRSTNIYQNNMQGSQVKANRPVSIQPQSTKQSSSKPITISMQKYLNESATELNSNKKLLSPNKQIELTQSKEISPQDSSIIINEIGEQFKCQSPPKSNHQKAEQSSRKKIVKIKNHSSLAEHKDTLSSKKKLDQQKIANSICIPNEKNPIINEDPNKKEKIPIQETKYATLINLNVNESINPQQQQNHISPSENNNNKLNLQTPKSSMQSPKSILKPTKDWSESPSNRNNLKGNQDFTLGYDSQVNFYQENSIPPSQPTHYSNIYQQKKIVDNSNLILNPLNQSNYIKQEKLKQGYTKTQFIREEEKNQEAYQKFSQLQESDSVYRVQMGSFDNSMQFSQDFGYKDNNNEDSPTQAKFSFQYNQITEVSNTDEELSQQNTRNLQKGSNQGSKFTFLNSSQPNIKESLTNFSQKILQPMQIMHQSKIILDIQSPSQQNQLLVEQLSKLKNSNNQQLEDKLNQEDINMRQSRYSVNQSAQEANQLLSDQTYSTSDQTKLISNGSQNKFYNGMQKNDQIKNKDNKQEEQNDKENQDYKQQIVSNQQTKLLQDYDNNNNIHCKLSQSQNKENQINYEKNIEQLSKQQKQNEQNIKNNSSQLNAEANNLQNDQKQYIEQKASQNQNIQINDIIKKDTNKQIQNPSVFKSTSKKLDEGKENKKVSNNKRKKSVEESQFVIDLKGESYSNGFDTPKKQTPKKNPQLNEEGEQQIVMTKENIVPLIIDPFFN